MPRPNTDSERYSVICRHCGKGYKVITASHLRRAHGYLDEHPILEYKRRFNVRRPYCGDTLAKWRQNGKRRHDEWAARWPPKVILAAIRKMYRQVKAGQPYHFEEELDRAARRQFGSWNRAVRQAGLKYEELTGRMQWSPAKVLSGIRRLARQRRKHGTQAPVRLRDAAVRCFGTWEAAAQAAGIDYEQFSKRELWTAERVLTALRKRARIRPGKRGRVSDGLRSAAIRHFGSYRAAAKAAGIEFKVLSGKRTWTRDAVVKEIQKLAKRRRREPTGHPPVLREAAKRHFGSWNAAVRAAGLDPAELRRLRWVREARRQR